MHVDRMLSVDLFEIARLHPLVQTSIYTIEARRKPSFWEC